MTFVLFNLKKCVFIGCEYLSIYIVADLVKYIEHLSIKFEFLTTFIFYDNCRDENNRKNNDS
jgi:hypothetical protein